MIIRADGDAPSVSLESFQDASVDVSSAGAYCDCKRSVANRTMNYGTPHALAMFEEQPSKQAPEIKIDRRDRFIQSIASPMMIGRSYDEGESVKRVMERNSFISSTHSAAVSFVR